MAQELLRVTTDTTVSQVHSEAGNIYCTEVLPTRSVKKILDENSVLRNHGQRRKGAGRLIGRIPITTYHEWHKEWTRWDKLWGIPKGEFLERKLRERDHSKLRLDKA